MPNIGVCEFGILLSFFFVPGTLVARAAYKQGKTWWLWGLAGVIFGWIGSIILLLILDRGPAADPQ